MTYYKQTKSSTIYPLKSKNVLLKLFITFITYVFSILPGLIVNTTLVRLDLHTPSNVRYI